MVLLFTPTPRRNDGGKQLLNFKRFLKDLNIFLSALLWHKHLQLLYHIILIRVKNNNQ